MEHHARYRRIRDRGFRALCLASTLLAILPLGLVVAYVAGEGIRGLSWGFFIHLPAPVGEPGGGMGNAIVGTILLVTLAALLSLPLGILSAVFLSEYGGGTFGRVVRFSADALAGVPSIVAGLFGYALLVLPMHRFSAVAGAAALALLMTPTITRSAEELLKLVPDALREGALALGIPRWRATLRVILRTALPGILTGVLLAVARAAGETAPLLFTAFGNPHWSRALDEPVAALPLQIYTYAISPFEEWHRQAWSAALVLLALVLLLNLGARLLVGARGASR